MRKAALLDEEQWHAQRTLHDMSVMKMSTEQRKSLAVPGVIQLDKDEDAAELENMDDAERAEYEEEIREKIMREIDKFLTEGSIEEELKNFKAELPIEQLEGAKPHVKCALFVVKMCNKFNAVSNRIISSYNWELNRKKVIPKDPALYRKMLREELHLSPAELVFEFISSLVEAEKRRRDALRTTKSPYWTQALSRHANTHQEEEGESKVG